MQKLEPINAPISSVKAWCVSILLAVCYCLSYLDRVILSTLTEPIKASLQISDTQIGLLQGVSFSLFYVIASLPLAYLCDHGNRPRLIAACMSFWNVMTMACGVATNYWSLLLARIGMAMGEAG